MTDALVQLGRRRERLVGAWIGAAALLMIMLTIACGLLTLRRAPLIDVGRVANFPPGSVTPLELDIIFKDPAQPTVGRWSFTRAIRSPLHVWLVHDPQAGWFAVISRDPRNGCQVVYQPGEANFIDPCHGAHYTRAGMYVHGPATRNLDRLGVTVTRDGHVLIDPYQIELGQPIQRLKLDL